MYYNLPDKYFYPVVEKDDLEFEDNLFRSMDVEAGEEKEKREVLDSTEGNEVVEDNEVNVVSEREENGSNIDIKEEGVIEEPVGEMRGEEETEDSTEDSILEEADEEYSSSDVKMASGTYFAQRSVKGAGNIAITEENSS